MNVNTVAVQNLVSLFVKLNDKAQIELMGEAYRLYLKQQESRLMERDGKTFANEHIRELETEKRVSQRANQISNILENLDRMEDAQKAELLIVLAKLNGDQTIKMSDVEIRIKERSVFIKSYIKEMFPDVDYTLARKNVEQFLKNSMNENSKKNS